jgi:hypothetical protein
MAITKLQSEALNLADDYTFTGTVSGAANTMIDQYRLDTSLSMSTLATYTNVTANLSQSNSDSASFVGTGMTNTSGIFSFPRTGHYLIKVQATFYQGGADYMSLATRTTTDNSNYNLASRSMQATNTGTNNYASESHDYIFNVTDITTHKVVFSYFTQATAQLVGGGRNQTAMTFIRLGDT